MSGLDHRRQAARGASPGSLLLAGGAVVDVLGGTVRQADVLIDGDRIAGLGRYRDAQRTLDVRGCFVLPGLIDSHIHLESSLLTPDQFARAVVPHGTSAVICDPHEIANVLGRSGVEYILAATAALPLDVHVMVPSSVPATPFETAGARLGPEDVERLLDAPRVLGLAEVMNVPGALAGEPELAAKLAAARARHKPIDGHAPGLGGADLAAYVGLGISSDHEATTAAEATEKVGAGMHVMLREGSAARNLAALLPAVTGANWPGFSLCCDDRQPVDLLTDGHVDAVLRRAVGLGLDPVRAVQLATVNPARHFGLVETGAIAPGFPANLVVVRDLAGFAVRDVVRHGRLIVENGVLGVEVPATADRAVRSTVHVGPLTAADLVLRAEARTATVIDLVPDQIVTRRVRLAPHVRDGAVVPDPRQDVLKLVVIERHHASGRVGRALVRGFRLSGGALASTVAHDSHNVIAVGCSDQEILTAVEELVRIGGGLVAVQGSTVLARLALPIAGLLSDQPLEDVAAAVRGLRDAARLLGCPLADPFMTLSFLALPVIPELKLTDRGLFDVARFQFISPWEP